MKPQQSLILSIILQIYGQVQLAACFSFSSRSFLSKQNSASDTQLFASDRSSCPTETRSYEHDGYTLTYQYKPASPEFTRKPPILLIHPVGIGICSWFWKRLLESWDGPAMYAVNLIGCGTSEGSDPWNPDEKGMAIPLGWVKGCESLMEQVILPDQRTNWGGQSTVDVVVQGGLAPVGIQLAHRNADTVKRLVLTSPPTYEEMTTAVPETELERNYNFLRSPILGKAAFSLLESRRAIEFFSNAFLFTEKCDTEWLDKCDEEMGPAVRPPVQVFNAGFCQHRSWETELKSMVQPLLILQGKDDVRERDAYTSTAQKSNVLTIPGKNVLPWESATAVTQALREFLV